MTIDEAILTLENLRRELENLWNAYGADAIELGIEALKHYQDSSHFACGCLLPGQTSETEE